MSLRAPDVRSRTPDFATFTRSSAAWLFTSVILSAGLTVLGVVALPLALALVVVALVLAVPRYWSPLLGASLPIYSIGPVPPTAFEAARTALVLAVAAQLLLQVRRRQLGLHPAWWLLSIALAAAAATHGQLDGALTAVSTLGFAAMGTLIGRSEELPRLLTGFRIAALLSGAVAVMQALGFTALSPAVEQSLGHWGLSYRSTALSYDLAIAVVLWVYCVLPQWRSRPVVVVVEGCTIVAGLLVGGGRGGLIAAAVALIIYPLMAGRRYKPLVVLAACAGVALVVWRTTGSELPLTLARALNRQEVQSLALRGYTSGRGGLYEAVFERIPDDGLWFGAGFDATVDVPGTSISLLPHNVVLTMLLFAGLPAALAATWLLVVALHRAFVAARHPVELFGALLVVMVVRSLLESGGVLLGATGVLLFAAVLSAAACPTTRDRAADAEPAAS